MHKRLCAVQCMCKVITLHNTKMKNQYKIKRLPLNSRHKKETLTLNSRHNMETLTLNSRHKMERLPLNSRECFSVMEIIIQTPLPKRSGHLQWISTQLAILRSHQCKHGGQDLNLVALAKSLVEHITEHKFYQHTGHILT